MDAPPIRYARTRDGANIAYWTLGDGPSVMVHMPTPASHVRNEWELPEIASWYRALSSGRTLVAYDARRRGLSEPPPEAERPDPERHYMELVDSFRVDLEGVLDATIGNRPVTLLASWVHAWAAMQFAAAFPQRVANLVLWMTSTRGAEMYDATVGAVTEMGSINPPQYARTMMNNFMRWSSGNAVDRLIEATGFGQREPGSGRVDAFRKVNLDSIAASLSMPTLVLHSRDNSFVSEQAATRLAARIPNARLVVMDGESLMLPFEVAGQALEAINAFIDPPEPKSTQPAPHDVYTILFTDVEASTALTQRLGDEGAQELLRGHNTTVRGALDANGGREVKHTGDGIMASFPSAVAAVSAALQIQGERAGGEVRVRIGLNAGEPIAEDDDLFGTAVQLAARVTDRAEPGQVLVTRVVADLCAGKTFKFASIGAVSMKGFDDAIELYEATAEVGA